MRFGLITSGSSYLSHNHFHHRLVKVLDTLTGRVGVDQPWNSCREELKNSYGAMLEVGKGVVLSSEDMEELFRALLVILSLGFLSCIVEILAPKKICAAWRHLMKMWRALRIECPTQLDPSSRLAPRLRRAPYESDAHRGLQGAMCQRSSSRHSI